jgi:glutathione S-transferase
VEALEMLEPQLVDRPFVAGSEFTIADITSVHTARITETWLLADSPD